MRARDWTTGAWALLTAALLGLPGEAMAQDLVLRGELTGADHQTYREVPFEVPAGTGRITVEVGYTGREARTTIDLGLRDPERFRGWSGGNKARFTVSAEEATPSYLPGTLPAGTWSLVLGVPNIRPTTRSTYEARIWFDRENEAFAGFAETPLEGGPGWYRGDLHSHTGHSDASCRPRGRGDGSADPAPRVPCPVYRTVEAATAAGLDFIAVTDHNTTSHAEALRELQIGFDDLLLIPGREITTFQGHANIFGPTAYVDFQVGGPRAPTMNAVIEEVAALGGVFSVNHPASPSGEVCMGCGWTAPETDWSRVQAIEVVNGGSMRALGGQAETPLSGIPFWETLLNQGHRLTAIGGSDNHDADLPFDTPSAIGRPTTVIWADALSQPAVLAGLRAGRVFIDLDGDRGRSLEFSAEAGGARVEMGGALTAPGVVRFTVKAGGLAGGRIEVIRDGRPAEIVLPALNASAESRAFDLPIDGARAWVRINVRDGAGRLILVGNPIYLNR